MICLNGGMSSDLAIIKLLMKREDNPYPWSYFNESNEAMNGMLTNVAVVLPERIYETASLVRAKKYNIDTFGDVWSEFDIPSMTPIMSLTQFEVDLINLLNSCGLAR
jgi:hypothetical protein